MNVLPVIERELRAGSRQRMTYLLRVLAGGALLGTGAIYWLTADPTGNVGGGLFQGCHSAVLIAIWVLAPLLIADSISRERREGTLTLLFLTPLRPGDIVLAKAMAQGLRALTVWLAALPVLTIPVMLGGVSWKEALLSVMLTLSSLCLSLAVGLTVSACCRNHVRALAGTSFFSLATLTLLLLGISLTVEVAAEVVRSRRIRLPEFDPARWLAEGIALAFNADGLWGNELRSRSWGWAVGAFAFVSMIAILVSLWLIFGITARTVGRVWREEPPSARVLWLQAKFTTPVVFTRAHRRWLRWQLARNPIGWLERRSWNSRLAAWGWIAAIICVHSILWGQADHGQPPFSPAQHALAWLLMLNVAVNAAASFRRERESGALELLLVTPLSEWQIVGGRLRGMWGKFLLPQVSLGLLWLANPTAWYNDTEPAFLVFCAGGFLCLPVIGLCYSLLRGHFIAILVSTLVMGLLVPWLLAVGAFFLLHLSRYDRWPGPGDPWEWVLWLTPLVQIISALLHLEILSRQFRSRRFLARLQ